MARSGGAGRSSDTYASTDFSSYADFSRGAMDALSKLGGSLDLLEKRVPSLAGTIYRGIGSQFTHINEDLQKTKLAVEEMDKGLEKLFINLSRQRKIQTSSMRQIGQELYNDMLASGKQTRKIMAGLSNEEQAVYRDKLQRQQNDMKKAIPKFKVLKHALFDADPKAVKEAMMAPLQGTLEGLKRLKNSVAGRTMMAMIPGQKAMKDGIEKTKDWVKGFFTGDIWTTLLKTVFTVVQKAADIVKKVFTFDVFGFMRQKFAELKALYESIPGYQQAAEAYQNIQSALAEVRRQYGGTVQMSRELTNEIYAASNATILVADNTRALLAVQAAGVRNTEDSARLMREVAAYSKAWGVSEEEVAQLIVSNRTNLRMTADDAYAAAAAAGIFADRMAQAARPGDLAASAAQQAAVLTQNAGIIQRYQMAASGTDYESTITQTVQRDLMALRQLEAQSNLTGGEITQMYSEFGTTEGTSLLAQMLGDPIADVQAAVMRGEMPQLMQRLFNNWDQIFSGENAIVFQEALADISSIAPATIAQQVIPNLGKLSEYTDAAAASFVGYAEALDEANEKATANRTPMQALTGDIEVLANSMDIGGIKLGEIAEIMDVFDQRLGIFSQGFGFAKGASDFLFGPLSPIAQIITGAPLALAAIGGLTGEFNDTFAGMEGPLGGFFRFGQDTFNTFWPQVEEVLKKTWEGVNQFFTQTGYGTDGSKTLFGAMIESGVNWVVTNGPEIVRQVTVVVTEILDAMATAFETIEESNLGKALSTMFVSVLESAIPILERSLTVFINLAKAMLGVLREVLSDPAVAPAISGFVTDLMSLFKSGVEGAGGVLEDAFNTLKDYALPFMQEVGEMIMFGMLGILAQLPGMGWIQDKLDQIQAQRAFEENTRLDAYSDTDITDSANEMSAIAARNSGSASIPMSVELPTIMDALARAESQNQNVPANSRGAVGYFQMLPDTASTAYTDYVQSGGSTIGGYRAGHSFTASEINALSREDQQAIAQTHFNEILSRFAGRETPVELALMEYNGGAGAAGNANSFAERASYLLGSPAAWISSGGWGTETVTYVLRNMYMQENPTAASWPDDDSLYQAYLGWPRMPIPSDFGYTGYTSSVSQVKSELTTPFQGFGETEMAGLASGGIVTQPTIAVIGEGGQNEAVIPLDDWNRDEERRHGESVSELREIARRIEDLIRVAEDGGSLAVALGG